MKLDLEAATEVTPPHIETTTPWLQRAGVDLAKQVIRCIAVVAVLLLILIGIGEYSSQPSEFAIIEKSLQQARSASGTEVDIHRVDSLLEKMKEVRRSARDFWKDLSQFLLGNVLLPVLTAILGYVFAKNND